MKRILIVVLALLIIVLSMSACTTPSFVAADRAINKNIMKVDIFPDLPANYRYFDYKAKALSLDKVVFSFANNAQAIVPDYYNPSDQSTWNPLGFWVDQPRQPSDYNPLVTGYLKRSFALPTYVADNRLLSSSAEPITTVSMVLGSSFAGIDKSKQQFGAKTYDFVEMTLKSYDTGSKLVKNVGVQGQSFWYDIFPQIMFARLYDMYSSTPYMKEMVLNGADEWLEALPHFVKDGKISYEFIGYNVVLESPTLEGSDGHIEPPNGGLAFLFYSAYQITGDEKYLNGAKQVLDYFEDYPKNPNYEAMTDYAPYVAAALNARYGTSYDVGKMLDYVFEGDSAFRDGWSVLSGNFGGYPVDGLVGQGQRGADDYAFSMNSFHLASVLAPMVKYDVRYASAVGKYILNLVNNAKVFFPQNLSLDKQSMDNYLLFDKDGSICYEGFRANGYAMGDAKGWGQPCDLSLYSSAFIGALGGIVSQTNVDGILRIDLNNTDSFGENSYLNYLYYNPYDTNKVVRFEGGGGRYDLFDAVEKRVVARNVSGSVKVSIPAKSSRVLVVLPANSSYKTVGNNVKVNGITVARYQTAVNIYLTSRQELTSSSEIRLDYNAPNGDRVTNMKITFGGITVYDGEPIDSFRYDKSMLPDTDYTLRVTVTTQKGLTDTASKRVVAR